MKENQSKSIHKNLLFKKVLAFMLAVLMLVGAMPSNAFAANGSTPIGPDSVKGDLNDMLNFYNAKGYTDKTVRYHGLEYRESKQNTITLDHTRWLRSGSNWAHNPSTNFGDDDYFYGRYIIRFKDPEFYKNIDSIQMRGGAFNTSRNFEKVIFPDNPELDGSTWTLPVKQIRPLLYQHRFSTKC